ncbi:MMPL family transporter, partial [bacterium]|nr:MMPL family transporter [bacterium]
VGIGIDSAIHVFHRYREEGIENLSFVLKTTGGAVLFSALTTFVGFISLAFAKHNGMKSIGEMASVGIITVTVANIILFPLIITYLYKKAKESKKS